MASLSQIRPSDSNLSISKIIAASCVTLENPHEFNPMNETGFLPGYAHQYDEVDLRITNDRWSDHNDLLFESEATPFSHEGYYNDMNENSREHNAMGLHQEFTSSLLTPITTQGGFANRVADAFNTTDVDCTTGEPARCDFIRPEYSVVPSVDDVSVASSDDCRKIENCGTFELPQGEREIHFSPKYSKGSSSTQWNGDKLYEDIGFRRHSRHDIQSIDSTGFIGNGMDAMVFDNAMSRDSATHSAKHPSDRYYCLQSQDGEKEIHQWFPTDSLHEKNGEMHSFVDAPLDIKTGSNIFINESIALSVQKLGDPITSECTRADDLKNSAPSKDNSPRSFSANLHENKSLKEWSSKLHNIPKENSKNYIPFDSSIESYDNADKHQSEKQFELKSQEAHSVHISNYTYYSTPTETCDSSKNKLPSSANRFDSDDDCLRHKKSIKTTSSKQKQTDWSIENIQHQLELLDARRKKMSSPVNSAQQQLDDYKCQALTKSTETNMVDVDYMICSGVTVAGFRPRALIRKRSKVNIPSDNKDNGYWQKRRRNNDSARKSREMKKEKEKNFYRRALELEYENVYLHECLSLAEAELASIGRRISAPPINSTGIYNN